MLTLTDEDFHRLYTYIKKNYGIDLGKKRQLIVSRLSNMLTANGYTSFNLMWTRLFPDRTGIW